MTSAASWQPPPPLMPGGAATHGSRLGRRGGQPPTGGERTALQRVSLTSAGKHCGPQDHGDPSTPDRRAKSCRQSKGGTLTSGNLGRKAPDSGEWGRNSRSSAPKRAEYRRSGRRGAARRAVVTERSGVGKIARQSGREGRGMGCRQGSGGRAAGRAASPRCGNKAGRARAGRIRQGGLARWRSLRMRRAADIEKPADARQRLAKRRGKRLRAQMICGDNNLQEEKERGENRRRAA